MAVPAGTARTKDDDEDDENDGKGLKRQKVRKREFFERKNEKK